ncbi:hypothetical protein [Marinomonas fungiae]|uniref:Lipoprotein n=1 Tax=Marinomonas fungiae TaxID=1137284 RepID=A0A0K6IPB5_9GAMM|nr:hypothetical protein [Marinomonas fungiae]CUB04948.1 hypothetical protein Ga0061065_108163 [Marinomonas fungiae]
MKLGLLSIAAILLSGCTILGGSKSQIQEAYYVPVITPDRPANSAPKVHVVHRSDEPNSADKMYYVPVIAE